MLALIVAGLPTHGAEFSTLVTLEGMGLERSVVVVQCVARQQRRYWRSRGAILDVGATTPPREVILTAGHGLPSTPEAIRRNCSVRGERQVWHGIDRVWLGEGTGDIEHDWAVLLTSRRLGRSVRRLAHAHLPFDVWTQLTQEQKLARLLLLGVQAEQHGCGLDQTWLSAAETAAGLFTHSCRSWDGLSGSPIIIGMNHEPVVIGIQLGRVRRPLHGEGPPTLGIGRAIDATIAAAIEEAARLSRTRR